MPENTLLKHFFGYGEDVDPERQFNLNRKSRSRRMREIFAIARKHHVLNGFTPVQFRVVLEELGPSFVKVGQVLSTRSEILPQAYCDELSKLQTACDPLPFDQVMATLKAIYGDDFDAVFSSVDPHPLGSASLAQVHKATLANGETVAVKVQRPGVKQTMAQDIDIMRIFARRASRFVKDDAMLDLNDVVEEMWSTFVEETDFTREAENLQRFAELNKDCAFISCPRVYPEISSEYALVMEYVEGIPIYKHAELKKAGYHLTEIGEKILDNYASQILDDGFFHADPHPGNIIIRGGKIVYIDLGIMGRLTPNERAGFGKIVQSVGMGDSAALKEALLGFAQQKDNAKIDHARFLDDLDLLLGNYASCDVADLDIGDMINDILALTRMSKVVLPPSITNVSRGIVAIEGTVKEFIPNNSIINIINAHIKTSQSPKERLEDELTDAAKNLKRAADGSVEAAQYAGETLKMLTRGQLKFNMEVLGSDAPLATVSKIMNRLTIAIVIAGLFVGSILIAPYTDGPKIMGLNPLSFFGYAGAMVLSVWVIVDIWRRH